MEFDNLWVICKACNIEKGEKHWYEYEQYMLISHPHDYPLIKSVRPKKLLNSLKQRD